MNNGGFYSAVFGIIDDGNGKILFQKRKNVKFCNGLFQLPSGHLEGEELFKEALIREMKEELDISILEGDIEVLHIQHRVNKKGRIYFDIYLKVNKYSGEIKNNEPEKCSELKFIDLNNYNADEMAGFDVDVIKKIAKGNEISELVN